MRKTKLFSTSLISILFLCGSAEGITLEVTSSTSSHKSMAYIGANVADKVHDPAHLTDMGMNTIRIFVGMERFQDSNPDGTYAHPSISRLQTDLQSNPSSIEGLVNYSRFESKAAQYKRDIFDRIKSINGMKPLLVLRPSANWGKSYVPGNRQIAGGCKTLGGSNVYPNDWVWREDDLTEWYAYVVTLVYWLKKNGYTNIDRFSAANEPNQQKWGTSHSHQGWCGTHQDYVKFAKATYDALKFAFSIYMDSRPFYLHAGALSLSNSSLSGDYNTWVKSIMSAGKLGSGSIYDVMDTHPYNDDPRETARSTFAAAQTVGVSPKMWLSEWGGISSGDSAVVKRMVRGLIRMNQPGSGFVYGSQLWKLYDDGTAGILSSSGSSKRPGYFALKQVIAAVGYQKTVIPANFTSATSTLDSVFTKNSDGSYNALISNTGSSTSVTLKLNAIVSSGSVDIYRWGPGRNTSASESIYQTKSISGGQIDFEIPSSSFVRLKIRGAGGTGGNPTTPTEPTTPTQPTNPVAFTVSNVSVASGKTYQLALNLQDGQKTYIDRDFTYASVTSIVKGAAYIRTANDDKTKTGSNFLSFRVSGSADVYVLVPSNLTPPSWLASSGFTNVGSADGNKTAYKKKFAAGTVTLGAPYGTSSSSMYSVAVRPAP